MDKHVWFIAGAEGRPGNECGGSDETEVRWLKSGDSEQAAVRLCELGFAGGGSDTDDVGPCFWGQRCWRC
jgi:hypothetical protein